MMLQLLETLSFFGAAAAAGATILSSVAPQWRRIVRLAAGLPEEQFAPLSPLSQLVVAERRIAVRRWSAAGRSVSPQWREAA